MKTIFASVLLFSFAALAETSVFTVSQLHCRECQELINQKVCEDITINNNFQTCVVKITDKKNKLGQVVIITKEDRKLDTDEIKNIITSAGDGATYKVKKIETK
jgi:hypothetical protein